MEENKLVEIIVIGLSADANSLTCIFTKHDNAIEV